ncbi:RNA polymerase subunit sigma-70 [Leifsonia shinshuensis]|uniref:RNA polymerase sigma-70 factor (ECF subfamily) n=1 Tax=Leifsonia shinshuensis TaxID=150026 RepID=A0A853CYW5_9MICO|nr:RNA polymerase subunit sigma-70 [Leifsonia shinshuensis]NYJ25399.1 RNA polymerase sigma-70 factor (ECF subfamily) [Leifsonia shinshuensis]
MTAFDEAELAGLRRGLTVFCYQLLGSPFEAEDAVQDALERSWRARDSFDPVKGSLSTWCYRIARNVCVDRLRETQRRPLPRDLRDPGLEATAPLVPALDVPWLLPAPAGWAGGSEVEGRAERREEVRLAVTAMLQYLSPLQRGAFVLRDVIGLTAAETAAVLEVSVASANSALQRARTAIGAGVERAQPPAPGAVERYARAIEHADVGALAALVADDLVFEMPPVPDWSAGAAPYLAFMEHLFAWRGRDWSTTPITAGGLAGFLLYRGAGEAREPHTVQLFDGDAEGAIGHVLVYQHPRLFALFEESAAAPR